MKMIIVAGGEGKRLRPLTNTIPKPMVEVNRKPILEHTLLHAKTYGITEFIFALCYLPEKITSYFGNGEKWGVHIEYIYEDPKKPQGSAGAIREAQKMIEGTFIVTYADILRDLNISKMIQSHHSNQAFVTINVYKRYGEDPKSMITFDSENKITSFIERPHKDQLKDNFVWANGSFYLFDPNIFEYIDKSKPCDFGTDIFPQLVNKSVYAFPTTGYFIDIGTKEKLEKAEQTFALR